MKEYRFKINGNEYSVAVNSISGNIADVTVNGTQYQVEMENAPATPVQAVPATQQPAHLRSRQQFRHPSRPHRQLRSRQPEERLSLPRSPES